MRSDEFHPHVITMGYLKWELDNIGELPKGKLPRKLKKRLKKELDNPDRKRVYQGTFKTISL